MGEYVDASHFTMWDKRTPAYHGALKFLGYNRPPAPYICVSQQTAIPEFSQYVFSQWKLQPPRVILSVTGGAQAFQMKPRLESMFSQGLGEAAKSTDAWIITGGTDTGVMEFVGKAVRMQDAKIVTMGIAPIGRVTHSETFHKYGELVSYKKTKENGPASAALEPNHTHFVFVEDEKRDWGGEIPFRSALEREFAHTVPIVLIVVQGGPGTLKTVELAVDFKFPVILVEGSGGAADAIGTYWNRAKRRPDNYRGVLETPGWKDNKFHTILEKIIKQDEENNCIRTFALDTDSTKAIDSTILRAILEDKNRNLTIKAKFLLAVEWNRIDFLQELLDVSHQSGSGSEEVTNAFKDALNAALECALVKGFEDVCSLLIQHNADISAINLCVLYHSIRFLREGGGDRPRKIEGTPTDIPPFALSLLSRVWRLREYVAGLSGRIGPENPRPTSITDLLFWAILSGRTKLAEVLWLHEPYPIHAGLMSSTLCHAVAQNIKTYKEGGDLFEKKAIGVLSQFTGYRDAKSALLEGWLFLGQRYSCNPMRIAVENDLKHFAAHEYCQLFIEKVLCQSGGKRISSRTSGPSLVFRSVFPLHYFATHGRLLKTVSDKSRGEKLAEQNANALGAMSLANFSEEFSHGTPNTQPTLAGFLSEARRFYDVPRVKFITNALFYAIFLALVSLVACQPPKNGLTPVDWLLLVWVFGLAADEIEQYYNTSKTDYFATSTNRSDIVMFSAWAAYYGLRFPAVWVTDQDLADEFQYWSSSLYIVVVVICYLRGIQILSVNYVMGPFLIMIQKMFDDFIRFGVMSLALLIGFQIAFMALARWQLRDTEQFSTEEFDGDEWYDTYPNGLGFLAFWALLGEFGDAFTYYEDSLFSLLLLLSYLVLSQVLLVNLLIAMMADTYGDVRDNADKEWKFNQAFLLSQYIAANPYPPPLNLLYILYRALTCTPFGVVKISEEATDTEALKVKVQDMRASYIESEESKAKNHLEYKMGCLEHKVKAMEISQQEDREIIEEQILALEKLIDQLQRRAATAAAAATTAAAPASS